MKTTRIFAFLLAIVMLFAVSACAPDEPDSTRIYTLNGTTGFGMAKLMNDNKDNSKFAFSVKSDASDVTAAIIAGDADIAALPTNAAANLYNVTKGAVKVLAVNTLGCLYLLNSTGENITSLSDLNGKTVYVYCSYP